MAYKLLNSVINNGDLCDRRTTQVKNADVSALYVAESVGEVKKIDYYDAEGNYVKTTVFEYAEVNEGTGSAFCTRDYDAVEV